MPERILIADDDAIQRRLVENMVQRCGYEAISVDTGEAALERLTNPSDLPIDAVLLDLVMPGISGIDVLGKMREIESQYPGDRPDGARRH